MEITEGYWWAKSTSSDKPFIVRVSGKWAFLYGDAQWFTKETFDIIKEAVFEDDHLNSKS